MSLLLPIDLSLNARFRWPQLPRVPFYFSLDMGLFDALPFSLDNEQQFNTLALGLKHFSETLLLQDEGMSRGVILYRGALLEQPDKRRFLNDLLSTLPSDILAHLWFESEGKLLSKALRLVSLEHFPYFEIKLDGRFVFYQDPAVDTAILLPESASEEGWKRLDSLLESYPNSRLIPESRLTHMWEGLNTLVVLETGYSVQAERKIAGFVAAGGVISKKGSSIVDSL